MMGKAMEESYEFRKRLECVHEKGMRDPDAVCGPDEVEVGNGFAIVLPSDSDDFVVRAARDFEEYLSVSMEVDARVVAYGPSPEGPNVLRVRLLGDGAPADAAAPKPRGCVIEVGEGGVSVAAADGRAFARALYHLEDLMNLRGGPFLKKGVESRAPLFDVRMTHSGYGRNLFPDAYLAQLAHAGMTAIIAQLDEPGKRGTQSDDDLRALIRRAAWHGLDTYLYSHITAFIHPDDGEAVFRETYGRLAGRYPEAKGIILVGESCQFPSKDPRVQPCLHSDRDLTDPRPPAGWFPCRDYPDWVRAVKKAIRERCPEMELVFWTYNWGWAQREDRLALIDGLPKDVTLMATFEMFERRTLRNGIDTPTADYTISLPGPGRYFVSEAERARKNDLRLYSQANAAGLTWDFGCVPYQPLPQQWRRRWDALASARSAWGLSGIMENHDYGWWPSFVSELEKEAFTDGGMPFETHLLRIAARDYGEENAEEVVAIWNAWSRDIADYAPTDLNQYGTFRIGPAYPFAFGGPPIADADFPGPAPAICRLDYLSEGFVQQLTPERMDNAYLAGEIELLEPMAAHYEDGERLFRRIATTQTGRRREKAAEMANLAAYLAATVRTAVNVKRGAIAFRDGDRAALLAAARDERANAMTALTLVEADSRLGWNAEIEYGGGPEQIRWKLALMERLYARPGAIPEDFP